MEAIDGWMVIVFLVVVAGLFFKRDAVKGMLGIGGGKDAAGPKKRRH